MIPILIFQPVRRIPSGTHHIDKQRDGPVILLGIFQRTAAAALHLYLLITQLKFAAMQITVETLIALLLQLPALPDRHPPHGKSPLFFQKRLQNMKLNCTPRTHADNVIFLPVPFYGFPDHKDFLIFIWNLFQIG